MNHVDHRSVRSVAGVHPISRLIAWIKPIGMRSGEQYYVLDRKTEPKPLRIFLQDGVHDEWPGGPEMGDWWMSNETMARALEFAGYDVSSACFQRFALTYAWPSARLALRRSGLFRRAAW